MSGNLTNTLYIYIYVKYMEPDSLHPFVHVRSDVFALEMKICLGNYNIWIFAQISAKKRGFFEASIRRLRALIK